MKTKKMWKMLVGLLVAISLLSLSGCGADPFETYTKAYRKVMENQGFDADLDVNITMDGVEKNLTGNFKVDNSGGNTILLLEVDMDGETMTQFSDGTYLYTEARGQQYKYPLGEKQEQEDSRKEPEKEGEEEGASPEWDVSEFLQEFASFIEAGKIQELGLLTPLDSKYVSKTTAKGNIYSLSISDAVINRFVDILSASIDMEGDTVSVKDLKNFTYEAVVEGEYVRQVTYAGSLTVTVPASIAGTDDDETYEMDIKIVAAFNNPGSKIDITLPSTEGFE